MPENHERYTENRLFRSKNTGLYSDALSLYIYIYIYICHLTSPKNYGYRGTSPPKFRLLVYDPGSTLSFEVPRGEHVHIGSRLHSQFFVTLHADSPRMKLIYVCIPGAQSGPE